MNWTVAMLGSGTNGSDSSSAQTALSCVAKTDMTDYTFSAVLKDGSGYRDGLVLTVETSSVQSVLIGVDEISSTDVVCTGVLRDGTVMV